MGILSFFHKIKIWLARRREPSIPYTNSIKRYGNAGETEVIHMLHRYLPSAQIKQSVIASTHEGRSEIDFLVLYKNKLFALEIKRWKGLIIENEDGFVQQKRDRWTGEIHEKQQKSPFKQLGRAIYLLRRQININAWINDIVYFIDDGLESVELLTDKPCFCDYRRLATHICHEGRESYDDNARLFFEKCATADYVHATSWSNSMRCVIDRSTLCFSDVHGTIPPSQINYVRIYHHRCYDTIHIVLKDGQERTLTRENDKITVTDMSGVTRSYALSKIDYIALG